MRQEAKSTAVLINRIMERLSPWYTIRLVRIDLGNNKVIVDIGSHRVVAQMVSGDDRIWFSRSSLRTAPTTIEFIKHLNGILAGKLRNDAGELVSA